MTETSVLTPGEWEALIHHTGDQAKGLVMRLAVHHGHVPPSPADCPICSKRVEPVQLDLEQRP